jgi:nucleotide-binding universal stress UspA family protein
VFPPRSILCPIDFSSASRAALQHARAIASRFGAEETVLYVEDPFLSQAARAAGVDAATTEAELRQFVERVAAGGPGTQREPTLRIVQGDPAKKILETASAVHADLVVMATHGMSGPRRLMFGSTTAGVLRQTTLPVLITPEKANVKALVSTRRVLAGVVLGDPDGGKAQAAAEVARAFGARLVLVHVVARTRGPRWIGRQLAAQDAERLTEARARLDTLAASIRTVPVESHVALGDPAEEIAATAADSRAGLIVLMLHPGRGLLGPRQGTITYRVLCSTKTAALALPVKAGR